MFTVSGSSPPAGSIRLLASPPYDPPFSNDLELGEDEIRAKSEGCEEGGEAKVPNDHEWSIFARHVVVQVLIRCTGRQSGGCCGHSCGSGGTQGWAGCIRWRHEGSESSEGRKCQNDDGQESGACHLQRVCQADFEGCCESQLLEPKKAKNASPYICV